MKIKTLNKAVIFAALRILTSLVFGYMVVGCILFPAWWKEFFFKGGILKAFYWRDGFAFLAGQFKQISPLAVTLSFVIICFIGYAVYWFGKHSSKSVGNKITFLERLAPRTSLVVILAIMAIIAIAAAALQPESYSEQKELQRQLDHLNDLLGTDALDFNREFNPPKTGVFLYVNDKLVLQQFDALRGDFEIKSITESIASEKGASASVSLPLSAGEAGLTSKQSTEKTIKRNAPELSSTVALQSLIRRFKESTNTFKIGTYSSLGRTSTFVTMQLTERGVELNEDQLNKLNKADKLAFETTVQKIHNREVLFCRGTLKIQRQNDGFAFEMLFEGVSNIYVKGSLQKQFMRDHMLFSVDMGKNEILMTDVTMFTVVQDIQRDVSDNILLNVVPYAIW